jgi:hypothetical protein
VGLLTSLNDVDVTPTTVKKVFASTTVAAP